LIDFPDDMAMTNYTAPVINNMMTQVGFKGFGGYGSTALGSLRDYYRLASNQRFDLVANVFEFSTNFNNGGGSAGFYRASLTKTNYTVHHEAAFFAVISNALAAARDQGFDFSTLTTDSHSNVVALIVLYSHTNWLAGLGPACQYLDWAPPTNGSAPFFSANGVNFRWYAISTAGQTTPIWPKINVTSHECSHMLAGWSDMDGRTQTGNGNGDFCVMSSGGGGNTQYPPLPSAYLRSRLGWINIVDIASNTPPLDAVLTMDRTNCYRYRNAANTNECFLVELRDAADAGGAGGALAIWHVDEDSILYSGYYGTSNTPTRHCRCQLIEADHKLELENNVNNGRADDLFFNPNTDRIDDYTTPSAHWWNGSNSCLAIGKVSSRSSAMRLCINPLILNANCIVHGLVGAPFSYTLQTRDGIAFSLSADVLPAGLALIGNTITGTPTSAGTTAVTLTADTGSASYTYPLAIRIAGDLAPVIDSPLAVAIPMSGRYLNYAITAAGADPITYGFTNGPTPPYNTLISGCTFSNGVFSGLLAGVGLFTNNLIITASNTYGCDTQVLRIVLNPAGLPGITNGASMVATGQVGSLYSFAFAYPDSPPPVFAVTAGALPPGLSLSYDGAISGAPTAAGVYTGVVAAGNVTTSQYVKAFTIDVRLRPVTLVVMNGGCGRSSLGGTAPTTTAVVAGGISTQIVYIANDWCRIVQLTSNGVPVADAAGVRSFTQRLYAVAADVSNDVSFALATTNQTGYPAVPIPWLTNWPEDGVVADPAWSVPDKYLLGLDPTTTNTFALNVELMTISSSDAVTVVRRTHTGGLSPDGMHGWMELQSAADLGTPFTNVIGAAVTGPSAFDDSGARIYTNDINGASGFFRVVIH
jgi:M6 family metalloprotease-like protein